MIRRDLTNAEIAAAVHYWQANRHLCAEDRIDAMVAESLLPPPVTDQEFDITLGAVHAEMRT